MNASASRVPDSARPASGGPGESRGGAAPKQRRAATRLPSARVPSITGIRVSPHNTNAVLVNISTSGVLVECDRRIVPGSNVTVLFVGGFEPSSVPGHVVRCSVAGIGRDGDVKYHVGIAFFEAIAIDGVPDPAAEHLQESHPDPDDAPVPVTVPLTVPVAAPVPVAASASAMPVLRNRW